MLLRTVDIHNKISMCVDTIEFFRQTSTFLLKSWTLFRVLCSKSSDVFSSTYSSLFILCFLAIKSQWLSFHSFQLHHEHVYFWEHAGNSHFAQHLYHFNGKLRIFFPLIDLCWVLVTLMICAESDYISHPYLMDHTVLTDIVRRPT